MICLIKSDTGNQTNTAKIETAPKTEAGPPLSDEYQAKLRAEDEVQKARLALFREEDLAKPHYSVGEVVQLLVDEKPMVDNTDPQNRLSLKIVELLGQPWRSGCVMKVICTASPCADDLDQTFVLKLLDPRFLKGRREHFDVPQWSAQRRSQYLSSVERSLLHNDGVYPEEQIEELESHNLRSMSPWKQESYMWAMCRRLYTNEVKAYAHLADLQGSWIPRLVHKVKTIPWSSCDPDLQHWIQYSGLLLEFIEGVALSEVSSGKPEEYWEAVLDSAVTGVNLFEYYDFEHRSLGSRNIMVRDGTQLDQPKTVFIDFGRHRFIDSKLKGTNRYHAGQRDPEEDILYQAFNDCKHGLDASRWDLMCRQILTGRWKTTRRVLDRGDDIWYYEDRVCKTILPWQVIMNDLWQVHSGDNVLKELEEKVRISRTASRIMEEKRTNLTKFGGSNVNWWDSAVLKIATILGFEVEGVHSRFYRTYAAFHHQNVLYKSVKKRRLDTYESATWANRNRSSVTSEERRLWKVTSELTKSTSSSSTTSQLSLASTATSVSLTDSHIGEKIFIPRTGV